MGTYHILKPLKPLPAKHKRNLYGFDIETTGKKNNFYSAVVCNDTEQYTFFSAQELLEFFLLSSGFTKCKPTIFATNLKFDFFGMLKDADSFFWEDVDFNLRNGRLISARLGDCKFNDTLSFWNASVEKLGNFLTEHKIISQSKMSKPDNFIRDETGEIIKAVKPRNKKEKEELLYYNHWDAFISFKFAQYLESSFSTLGCKMKSTIASTAMDLYRRKYLGCDIFQESKETLEFIHKAYAGGDCHAYVRGAFNKPVIDLDINSMYPFLMTMPLPDTNYSCTGFTSRELIKNFEGCCEAEVMVPHTEQYPFLIWKGEKDLHGNLMPVGTFRGHYTFLELREAMRRYGDNSVTPLGKAVFYKRTKRFLKQYALDLYELRKEMKALKNPLQEAIKGLMNNLYGKFGQKLKSEMKIPYEKLSREELETYLSLNYDVKLINEHAPDHLKFWQVTHESPDDYPAHLNPIWAASITAQGRLYINQWKRKVKGGCYYVDTDGLICPQKGNTDIGDSKELGEMKIEGKARRGIIVRPKTYFLETRDKTILKSKGFNNIRYVEDFINLIENKGTQSKRFIQFSESLRRKDKEVNEVEFYFKKFNLEDKKRNWLKKEFTPYEFQESIPWTIQKINGEFTKIT